MRILLVTPPLVQLNTPYPATTFLTGFLRNRGYDVRQDDPGLRWVLSLLSPSGFARLTAALRQHKKRQHHPSVAHLLQHERAIARELPSVLALLQDRDRSCAYRYASRRVLPEGPRFSNLAPAGHEAEYLDWAFGNMGTTDRARFFASLFLEDIGDAICHGIDPHFAFARYGEALGQSAATIDGLLAAAAEPDALTTQLLDAVTTQLIATHRPEVVGMSLPFPGTVLGALRMATAIKRLTPTTYVVWGGGYINTELRELTDARLFEWVDAVTYDDGERPLLNLLEYFQGRRPRVSLLRTRLRVNGQVTWHSSVAEHDISWREAGTPTTDGLPLSDYLGLIDMPNPVTRLWSDTRWNKLAVAHGCYWKRCAFCDLSLDYISKYQALDATLLVDRIEALIAETGSRGFHFVDEAAPPAVLKRLAEELIRRDVVVSWWGNIRFEKTFSPALCRLLARSGCIAVTGGLEAASNRLLALMQKGVTVEQVARVTKAFSDAGISVHAYLMYGFPSETVRETIDSLEYVRQLFVAGCLDSAFWHRFSATAHSPIGQNPGAWGIQIVPGPVASFAHNDLAFIDPTGVDHTLLGEGLRKAIYNYMLGLGLEDDVRSWFSIRTPASTVPKSFIHRALAVRRGPSEPTSEKRGAAPQQPRAIRPKR